MKRPKVLHIGKFYHPYKGGMEDHLRQVSEMLCSHVDLRVLVANTSPRTVEEVFNGVRITRAASLGQFFSTSLCPTMPFLVRRWVPDIVQVHLPNPMGHLAWAFLPKGPRLVVMWHSDIVRQKAALSLYRPAVEALLDRADRIVATSPRYIEYSEFLRPRASKCVVIPLGVDPDRLAPQAGHEALEALIRGGSEGAPRGHAVLAVGTKRGRTIVFVGRLAYYKGVSVLIDAMRKVDGLLHIVGRGPLEAELRQQVTRLSLAHKVRFSGEVRDADLPAYYRAADVFVLPSVEPSEAFGVVQLEAMACGKPVISTSLPTGVPWVNRDGETGLVVPPGDSEALAAALNTILDNPDLGQRLGEGGIRRVASDFSHRKVGERFLELYQELL